jgi:hypothetical protein
MWRRVRSRKDPHVVMSLGNLVEKADDPEVCYNLLELSPSRLHTPFWLP